MIVELYALPQWFTSPDDKPCLELFNYWVNHPAFKLAGDTIATPTLDDIEVQVGNNGDYSIKDMQAYNFIKYDTTWYQITNVELKQSNGVFYIYGKVDLYFTYLVSYFNTTGNRNGTPVFFKQKHLNRAWFQGGTSAGYWLIRPDIQFYLLNRYKQFSNFGKKVVKQSIIAHKNDYTSHYPTTENNEANGYVGRDFSAGGYSALCPSGKIYAGAFSTDDDLNPFGYYCSWYSNNGDLNYPNFYDVSPNGNPNNYPECYPCILWNITPNETNILPSTSYPLPYGLGGIGGTQTCSWNMSGTYGGTAETPLGGYANSGQSGLKAGVPWYDLIVDGSVADKYYSGVYLLPLPIPSYFNRWEGSHAYNTYSTVTNLNGFVTLSKVFNDSTNKAWGTVTSNNLDTTYYYPWIDPVIVIAQNNLYTDWNGTIPNVADLSYMEPALINYERFNVRLYGQDNTVDVASFGGMGLGLGQSQTGAIKDIIPYLMDFTLTISPPNMMLTNTPINVYHNVGQGGAYQGPYNSNLYVWNYNNVNDAIYSCVLKSRAPNVSNNWNNYMATSKNAYDTGLNVSQLMAQREISGALGSGASATASGNIIGAIFNPIGDIFSAVSQEIKYSYELTGMKQDMSRTSNMRVSATSTINTLFDSSFTLIIETPPLYEQIALVNYYALHGYLLERWDPFSNWYNRYYCNYVSILFFTNTMMVDLSATWKGRIDKMLENGFRVWSNVSELQKPSNGGWLTYDLVLINQTATTYPNYEIQGNNDELNYLNGEGQYDTATLIKNQSNFYTTQTNQKNPSVQTNKDGTQK